MRKTFLNICLIFFSVFVLILVLGSNRVVGVEQGLFTPSSQVAVTLPVEGGGVNSACAGNSDCANGLVCISKICKFAEEAITPTPTLTTTPIPSVTPTPTTSSNDWTGVDITIQDVEAIIIGIACWMMRVAGALMIIFLAWSGILFMSAGGEAKGFEKARDAFEKALLGTLVILAVYVIIATVANVVGLQNFSFIPLAC